MNPFPRPITGRTVDEMRRELEAISGECRATADELNGTDAKQVRLLLLEIAQYAERAHALVLVLQKGPPK